MVVCTVALIACWIATRPYLGIVHDALLYAAQALHGMGGGQFGDDLFFAYGSQDSFTLFSFLYRPLISTMGIARAHLAMTVLGQALWLAGLLMVLRAAYPDRKKFLAATAASALAYAGYGGFNVFQYGEGFATARLFAEALVLGAMALGAKARWATAASVPTSRRRNRATCARSPRQGRSTACCDSGTCEGSRSRRRSFANARSWRSPPARPPTSAVAGRPSVRSD